jgi:hypothetical protein
LQTFENLKKHRGMDKALYWSSLLWWDRFLLYLAIVAYISYRLLLGLVMLAVFFISVHEWRGLGYLSVFIVMGFWAKGWLGETQWLN